MGAALRAQGHQVRLIPAQFVKPYRKSNKNDFIDGEAIARSPINGHRPKVDSYRVIIERGVNMASLIVGVIFVCLGASCAAAGSVLVFREIAAVNRQLPDGQQISYSFIYPGKMQKIKAEYKRLYLPGNSKHGA